MRTWLFLLGGLIVWAVHFFALYAVASVFPDMLVARVLTVAITLPCLAADLLLFVHARRREAGSAMERWVKGAALSGIGLSGIAVVWQMLPALLG